MFTDHFDDCLSPASGHHMDSRRLPNRSQEEATTRVLQFVSAPQYHVPFLRWFTGKSSAASTLIIGMCITPCCTIVPPPSIGISDSNRRKRGGSLRTLYDGYKFDSRHQQWRPDRRYKPRQRRFNNERGMEISLYS
jgi:hypothetical protein